MNRRRPNRLIHEKSPYLLQHAYNPVNWYPWGEEAFALARAEDRPVFLSIGYSTCHWCHVMARESFENERVAALLNASFVNIKVDREERPEIDQIYQAARDAGAVGGKLLGAGGGGFMLLFAKPERHAGIRERLKSLIHVPFRFEDAGSRVVLYQPNGP